MVSNGKTTLLIDAGVSCRAIETALGQIRLDPSEIDAILITHEHSDHIKGMELFSRRYDLPVYANAPTWRAMEGKAAGIAFRNIRTFITGQNFYIGDMDITPFATSHDTAQSVGYKFCFRGSSLVYLTDTGCITPTLQETASGADLLFLESNHDVGMLKGGRYPYPLKQRILSEKGHLSNNAAGELLCRLYPTGVRRAILAHLSKDNNTERIAYETVRGMLRSESIPDEAMFITVARRDGVTGVFDI